MVFYTHAHLTNVQSFYNLNHRFEVQLFSQTENHGIQIGDKVYTSGKEGIFSPGIPIGEVAIDNSQFNVSLFSDISQILFVNINLGDFE